MALFSLTNSYFKMCLLGFGLLFVWEHIARTKGSTFKPSVAISWLSETLGNAFYNIGVGISKLSSFLTYIKLEDLYKTAHDLFKPIFELAWSPFQIIKGYCETALTYKYPIIITIGSLLLCSGLICMWYIWGHYVTFLHFWPLTRLPLKQFQ